tara:strand:+ start:281 stop:424 length:144 start_codon:yes stop_codon:yes gene_type:complete
VGKRIGAPTTFLFFKNIDRETVKERGQGRRERERGRMIWKERIERCW